MTKTQISLECHVLSLECDVLRESKPLISVRLLNERSQRRLWLAIFQIGILAVSPAKGQSLSSFEQQAPSTKAMSGRTSQLNPTKTEKRDIAIPPKAASSQVDPMLLDRVRQCISRYQSSSTWQARLLLMRCTSANLPIHLDSAEIEKLVKQSSPLAEGSICVERPERLKVELGQPGGNLRYISVCDGKDFWRLYLNADGTPQRCVQVPSSGQVVTQALDTFPEELNRILGGIDLISQRQKENRLLEVSDSGKMMIEGVLCSLVTMIFKDIGADVGLEEAQRPDTPTHDISRITLAISEKDHLLRLAVTERILWGRKGEVSIASFSQVQAGVRFAAREFVFTPPAGVQITSFNPGRTSFNPRLNGIRSRSGSDSNTPVEQRSAPTERSTPTGSIPARISSERTQHSTKAESVATKAGSEGVKSPTPRMGSVTPFPNVPRSTNTVVPSVPSSVKGIVAHTPIKRDFGSVSILDKRLVRDQLVVRNTASFPIQLNPPQGSCFCISGRYLAGGNSPILKPGDQVAVDITMDLGVLRPGAIQKAVVITAVPADDPVSVPKPLDQITFTGILKPSIKIDPDIVDLGQWRQDQGKSVGNIVTVIASFDPRLVGASDLDQLKFSPVGTDGIKITPLKTEPGALTRKYQIEVTPGTPLGPILTNLRLVPPGVTANPNNANIEGPTAAITDAKRLAWGMAEIVVVGNVLGDVQALPSLANFGVVKFGSGTTIRQISLTGIRAGALDNAEVYSDSTDIIAKIQAPTPTVVVGTPPPSQKTLVLEFNPTPTLQDKTAPSREFRGQVTVKLTNGQRLVIPVSAVVQGTGNSPNTTTIRPVIGTFPSGSK